MYVFSRTQIEKFDKSYVLCHHHWHLTLCKAPYLEIRANMKVIIVRVYTETRTREVKLENTMVSLIMKAAGSRQCRWIVTLMIDHGETKLNDNYSVICFRLRITHKHTLGSRWDKEHRGDHQDKEIAWSWYQCCIKDTALESILAPGKYLGKWIHCSRQGQTKTVCAHDQVLGRMGWRMKEKPSGARVVVEWSLAGSLEVHDTTRVTYLSY